MSSTNTEAVQPFEPLVTERLVIRAPVREDLQAFIERRNDPEVARYQDWSVPYSADEASKRIDETMEQGGLVDGTWWMVTVALRTDGTPIGDIAINISWGWRASEVGYSLATPYWRQGYAAEALNAVLNHLYDDRGLQRVSASLHPDNIASAMLLERSGFSFEGQTKQSFWEGDGPDAAHTDGAFYGLTRADREAWLERPTSAPGEVKLIDITNENYRDVAGLGTHKSQEQLVAPVLTSFADALFVDREAPRPVLPRMWAIEADGELSGFVMIAEATKPDPEPYLRRLLIDRRFQRRGIGSRAVELVEDYCRSRGATSIKVSWQQRRGSPEPFYLARGYVPTGERPHDEVEARKQLG